MKTKLLLTGLAIIAATSLAGAQSQGKGKGQGKRNGNGNGKGKGNCTYKIRGNANISGRNGTGKCFRYTDANKNGVCDRFEARTKK